MIPVKIKLQNFMSYREIQSLSFESIRTACISGNNGNGKSALIDAITWALWGQSRASSDDELVSTGKNEVTVDFEFLVNNQKYRIIRTHTKPKTARGSGKTDLQLQAVTPMGNKVLSGDSVTQTQQNIVQLLHMDYDTFINSAFIRQGRADEFTKRRPAERKQVLANILQLSFYDELEEKAKEVARERDTFVTLLKNQIKYLEDNINLKPRYQKDLDDAQLQLAQSEINISQSNQKLNNLRKEREILENKKTRLEEIDKNLENNRRNLKAWEEQAHKSGKQITEYQKLLAQKEEIQANYSLLQKTRQQVQELDDKLSQLSVLKEQKQNLELKIRNASQRLDSEKAISAQRLQDWEQAICRLPGLQKQIEELNIQMADLATSEKQSIQLQNKVKEIRSQISAIKTHQAHLSRSIKEVDEKLDLLGHTADASCPLCESELGVEGRNRIEQKFLAEKNSYQSEVYSSSKDLSRLEEQEKQLENQINQIEAAVKYNRQELQTRQGRLDKEISDIDEIKIKMDAEKTKLVKLENRITQKDYALQEQAELTRVEKAIADLQYDGSIHESCRRQVQSLATFEKLWLQLNEAENQLTREKAREAQALKSISEINLQIEQDNQNKQELTVGLANYDEVKNKLMQYEKEHLSLLENQKRLQESLGGAKTKLEGLVKDEESLQEKTRQLKLATSQAQIFKDLALAFGKKGLQAMLIDMAIPEIEAEANLLLARMTDNRMFIKMETQRESKSGSIIETLDIKISDELGTRNYEMFSGGEAFRINFAIRIALSRLLARRAGAPLPTLIIDEGFGTQDGTGIEKIKEAITSIQDDFEKILVITHINDFKDAFPVRIEVVKTSEGSKVYLN